MKSFKELNDLRGPVKTARVETSRFEEEDGQRVEKFMYAQSLAFDSAGNVTEVVQHIRDGSSFRTSYRYDAGLLLEVVQHDAGGAVVDRTFHEYDEEGRETREGHITEDGTRTVFKTFTYAADGNRIEEQNFNQTFFGDDADVAFGIEGAEGSSHIVKGTRSIKIMRDAESKPREVFFYDAGDVLLNRVVYTYDDRGNLIEETQHVGDVSPFGPCDVSARPADATGEESPPQRVPTEEELAEIAKMFAPGSPLIRQVYKYDEQGRRIETAMVFHDEVADRRTSVYDEEGRRIEEVYYDEGGALRSKAIFDREYDTHGNWVRESTSSASNWDVEFGLSTPSTVNRRTITYY